MSDVPDETENESILAFRSKNEEETERVQKAAEDIAARSLKTRWIYFLHSERSTPKKRKLPRKRP